MTYDELELDPDDDPFFIPERPDPKPAPEPKPTRAVRKSTKAAEKIAMGHALEWVSRKWPKAPLQKAQPVICWIPDGAGGRRPISREEDLFGCFDLLVAPARARTVAIQVTTAGIDGGDQPQGDTSAAVKRMRKIKAWIREHFGAAGCPFTVYVLAWVPRRHFRVWQWASDHFGEPAWVELKPEKATALVAGQPLLDHEGPAF